MSKLFLLPRCESPHRLSLQLNTKQTMTRGELEGEIKRKREEEVNHTLRDEAAQESQDRTGESVFRDIGLLDKILSYRIGKHVVVSRRRTTTKKER